MKRIALTCKDPGKFFHDCKDCEFYNGCDYFQKVERRVKKRMPFKIQKKSAFLDIDTGKMYKWDGKKWI